MEGMLPSMQPEKVNKMSIVVINTVKVRSILFMMVVSYPNVIEDPGSFLILLYVM